MVAAACTLFAVRRWFRGHAATAGDGKHKAAAAAATAAAAPEDTAAKASEELKLVQAQLEKAQALRQSERAGRIRAERVRRTCPFSTCSVFL